MKEESNKHFEPCPQFDGNHENYINFRDQILAWLQTTSTACIQMMGNRGEFELPADFLLATRPPGIIAGPFVPRPFPGDRPVLPIPALAPVVAVHNDAVNVWKEDMANYSEEINSSRKAKLLILKAVPAHCIAALEDPIFKFQNVTLQEIREHLDGQFLILPPSLIVTTRNSLCIPWSPSEPFAEFIGKHRKAHVILAANGQVVPEAFKFYDFEECLKPSGVFASRIEIYKIALPNTVQQTFDTLAPALLTYYLTLPMSITAKAAGYAASVLSTGTAPPSPSGSHIAPSAVHPDPLIAGILANLHSSNAAIQGIQSLLQGQQKTGGGGGGGGNKKRAAGGSGGAAVSPPYCWTHGCIGHASPACVHKQPNHMDAATYTNQMRGEPA
jgi:hypothetical protein